MTRKPTRRRAPPARDQAAVARFVEAFALVMSASGMPRMPGRVFVALLTADAGRRTAAQLAEGLQVSRAAVSGAVKYLVQIGLARREREPGARVDQYVVDGETWFQSFAQRDALTAQWEASLAVGVAALGATTPAGRRLDETRRFFAFIRAEYPRLLRKWAAVRRAPAV